MLPRGMSHTVPRLFIPTTMDALATLVRSTPSPESEQSDGRSNHIPPKCPLLNPLARTKAAPSTGVTFPNQQPCIFSSQVSPWFSVPTAARWPVQDLSGTSPTIGPAQGKRTGPFQGMNHVDVIFPDVPCQKAAQTGGGLCAGPGLSSRLPLRHFWPVRVRRAVPS